MAEAGEVPVERLADTILEAAPPHFGKNIRAPEAVANKAIKAAAAKLEREEMAASPTRSMRRRDEGGLASAVQVQERVKEMQPAEGQA